MYESPLWQACVCSTHHVNVVKEEATHFRCKKVEQNARYLQAPHGSQTSRTRYSNLCWQVWMLRLLNNKVMSSRISNSTPGLPGLPIPRVYVPTCATKAESFRSDQCVDCNSLFDDAKKKRTPIFLFVSFFKAKTKISQRHDQKNLPSVGSHCLIGHRKGYQHKRTVRKCRVS